MDYFLIHCGKRDKMVSAFEELTDVISYVDGVNRSTNIENYSDLSTKRMVNILLLMKRMIQLLYIRLKQRFLRVIYITLHIRK